MEPAKSPVKLIDVRVVIQLMSVLSVMLPLLLEISPPLFNSTTTPALPAMMIIVSGVSLT